MQKSVGEKGIWKGMEIYEAFTKSKSSGRNAEKFDIGGKMFSFVPPTSGMFLWVRGGVYGSSASYTESASGHTSF